MNWFIYLMIFIAGTVFGSFFSLAVYRIPRKENITYVQSHCTSCNHKLYFWDLIPIWSYVFLRGRCRYCKEKIRPRYILLEIFSGCVFLLIALCNHISITSDITTLIHLCLMYLFVVGLFLVGGIDKENYIIPDNVNLYIVLVGILHLLFLGITGCKVYDNMFGFFIIPVVLLMIDFAFSLIHKNPIGYGDIKYLATIGLFLRFSIADDCCCDFPFCSRNWCFNSSIQRNPVGVLFKYWEYNDADFASFFSKSSAVNGYVRRCHVEV